MFSMFLPSLQCILVMRYIVTLQEMVA